MIDLIIRYSPFDNPAMLTLCAGMEAHSDIESFFIRDGVELWGFTPDALVTMASLMESIGFMEPEKIEIRLRDKSTTWTLEGFHKAVFVDKFFKDPPM